MSGLDCAGCFCSVCLSHHWLQGMLVVLSSGLLVTLRLLRVLASGPLLHHPPSFKQTWVTEVQPSRLFSLESTRRCTLGSPSCVFSSHTAVPLIMRHPTPQCSWRQAARPLGDIHTSQFEGLCQALKALLAAHLSASTHGSRYNLRTRLGSARSPGPRAARPAFVASVLSP